MNFQIFSKPKNKLDKICIKKCRYFFSNLDYLMNLDLSELLLFV